jgi:hypothetical protein
MKKCNSFFLNDLLMHIISENCTLSHIVRHLTMHLPTYRILTSFSMLHYIVHDARHGCVTYVLGMPLTILL